MKKNNLINLALLLIVALLGLLAAYEPGLDKPAENPPLLTLERDGIQHIEILRQGQETIELQQDDRGKWQLLQPVATAASDFRIDSLLRITGTKSLASFEPDAGLLKQYHLQQPKVQLILNNDRRILFGDNTPLDHRRYVMLDGRVHLISDTLYYHLIGEYPTFIRQQPLPENASIAALQLPELKLAWQGDRWELDPAPDDYHADQVTRLLDAWRYASAIQVKRYDGHSGEKLRVHLKGEEAALEFLLTARNPDLILARPDLGIQYHFPAETARELLSLPTGEQPADVGEQDGIH